MDPSPSKLKALREPDLKLLVNGVPCDLIISNIIKEICGQLRNDEVKRQVIYWALL